MFRVQLALNVSNIDAAVDFYSKLFGAKPAKRRPGYANFAIAQPPLKLVLMENAEATERLNHLGIEVASAEDVLAASDRLTQVGLSTSQAKETTCCYAKQNKFWTQAPDSESWEIYAVLAEADTFSPIPESSTEARPEVKPETEPETEPEATRNNVQVCCA